MKQYINPPYELYQTSRTNVVEHIKHIYEEDELDEDSTCRKFRQVQKEGTRDLIKKVGSGRLTRYVVNKQQTH